jgi:hypothetical protein
MVTPTHAEYIPTLYYVNNVTEVFTKHALVSYTFVNRLIRRRGITTET